MNKYFVEMTGGTSRARQKTSHLNRFQIQKMDEKHLYINYFGKQKRLEPEKNMLFTNSNGSPVDFSDVKKGLVVEKTELLSEGIPHKDKPYKETAFEVWIDGKMVDEEVWSGHLTKSAIGVQRRLEKEDYPGRVVTVKKQWYVDGEPVETPFEFGPPEYKHHGPMRGTSPAFQDV